jgi:hypothetical protein
MAGGPEALKPNWQLEFPILRFGSTYVEEWCREMPNAVDEGEIEDGVNLHTVLRFSPALFMTDPCSAALACGWTAY